MTSTRDPQLEPFEALVGEWTIEALHEALPDVVVRGSTVFEWLEGKTFLIQRSRMEHPAFPDGIAVIGVLDQGLAMHSYDSRGVFRTLGTSFDAGVWRLWRDARPPDFSQRFEGAFADGDTLHGVFEIFRNEGPWAKDIGDHLSEAVTSMEHAQHEQCDSCTAERSVTKEVAA